MTPFIVRETTLIHAPIERLFISPPASQSSSKH